MSYIVATDTTANLNRAAIAAHDITVLPLSWNLDGQEQSCPDMTAFDAKPFYHALANKAPVRTSLINTQRFIDTFAPVMDAGLDVLYIGIASGISGTFAACTAAAAMLGEMYPGRRLVAIDSLTAGLGEGLIVLEASRLREQGCSLDKTAQSLTESRYRLHSDFTVDDLMYLKRGGRLGGVTALIGCVLQIKPILSASPDGNIITAEKIRGRTASLETLVERLVSGIIEPERQIVAINHGDCIEDARVLAAMIRTKCKPQDILIDYFEPVSAAHVGPGAMAVFYFGPDRRG